MLTLNLSQKVAVKLTPSGEERLQHHAGKNGYEMRDGLCVMPLMALICVFGGDASRFGSPQFFDHNRVRPTPTTLFNLNDEIWVKLTAHGEGLIGRLKARCFRADGDYYVIPMWEFMYVFGCNRGCYEEPRIYFDGDLEVRNPTSL